MTVRFLAQELYRWTQRVEELERAMQALPRGAPAEPRLALEAELRQARKEQEHFRAVLEAKKEKPMI
jgi:hypothetical protein